jgi:hypothetical protein
MGVVAAAAQFVNPLGTNTTYAVGALLLLHLGAFGFWIASVFMQGRQAAADRAAKRD